jgi:hypothetical protein
VAVAVGVVEGEDEHGVVVGDGDADTGDIDGVGAGFGSTYDGTPGSTPVARVDAVAAPDTSQWFGGLLTADDATLRPPLCTPAAAAAAAVSTQEGGRRVGASAHSMCCTVCGSALVSAAGSSSESLWFELAGKDASLRWLSSSAASWYVVRSGRGRIGGLCVAVAAPSAAAPTYYPVGSDCEPAAQQAVWDAGLGVAVVPVHCLACVRAATNVPADGPQQPLAPVGARAVAVAHSHASPYAPGDVILNAASVFVSVPEIATATAKATATATATAAANVPLPATTPLPWTSTAAPEWAEGVWPPLDPAAAAAAVAAAATTVPRGKKGPKAPQKRRGSSSKRGSKKNKRRAVGGAAEPIEEDDNDDFR